MLNRLLKLFNGILAAFSLSLQFIFIASYKDLGLMSIYFIFQYWIIYD